MIRHIASACLAFVLVHQNLKAQDVSKLTVPASPAFSILDYEPAAVMRPTNARDLAADVLNSFDENGKLLLNLGLEVTPYWLKSHPDLKRDTYLNPNAGQAFLQSFSLSAATVKDSASGDNKFGAGFRFKLYNGKPVNELETARARLKTKVTVVAIINGVKNVVGGGIDTRQKAIDTVVDALNKTNMDQSVIEDVRRGADEIAVDYTDTVADIKLFLDQLLNSRVEAYGELAKEVSGLMYQRQGLIVEFAGATGFNTSQKNDLQKIGVWGNVSYFVSTDDLFTLTARYMNQDADTAVSNFDIGLGFLKKTVRYNISIEGMFRWYRAEIADKNSDDEPITRLDKDVTYRLAVQGSYMISRDVSINLNLGKDFNSPFVSGSGFFSILGFNYSIFNKKPAELK